MSDSLPPEYHIYMNYLDKKDKGIIEKSEQDEKEMYRDMQIAFLRGNIEATQENLEIATDIRAINRCQHDLEAYQRELNKYLSIPTNIYRNALGFLLRRE